MNPVESIGRRHTSPESILDQLFWVSWSRSDQSEKRAFLNNLFRVLSEMKQEERTEPPKHLNWPNMVHLKNQIADPAINAFLVSDNIFLGTFTYLDFNHLHYLVCGI